MNNNCCSRMSEIPASLWIAFLALTLFLLQAGWQFILIGNSGDGAGEFIATMLIAVLMGGLFLRRTWAFPLTVVLYFLLIVVGLQDEWLHGLKNAIIGGFVLLPVLLNKDWLSAEENDGF